ncbi:glycosyltransferase family 2 protein [Agrobacterium fabrum]|uniref:glycosyltransferase family 2 protein n=1 Tax=Agrobacterium fabrum TaxID=1176649 RepID=UPI003BA001E5
MRNQFSISDITVISVCYKSDAVIEQMIASVPVETSIILVDNGKTNRFPPFPAEHNIQVETLEKNEGFGVGCNAGAAAATTPWLLFLNPDATIHPGALEQLLSAAHQYKNAAAFNPRIENSDGSAYFKRRSWLLPRNRYLPKGWPPADCTIPVLSGAAIFVSRELFLKVGGFDPNIFLYHEDDDLSLRLAEFGPLKFIRNSVITHASGSSSVRSPAVARFKAFHMARSRIYTGKKHRRPFPFFSTLIQALFLIFSPLMLVSERRRAKAIGFLMGCIHYKNMQEPFRQVSTK